MGAADLAAELRHAHGWRMPDAFQAAVALRHELRLATRITKDFNPDLHPFVVVPYTVTPRRGAAERDRGRRRQEPGWRLRRG